MVARNINNNKKVAIVGIGGVGGSVACQLAQKGDKNIKLSLVASEKSASGLRQNGLTVNFEGKLHNYHFENIYDPQHQLPPQDVIFLCTKSSDNPTCLPSIVLYSTTSTILVPLQNGLGKESSFREAGFKGKVPDVVVRSCCHKTGDACIDVVSWPSIILGQVGEEVFTILTGILSNTQLKADFRKESIEKELWIKFGFVIIISIVTSIYEGPCSLILADVNAEGLLRELSSDFIKYAHFKGVNICLDEFIKDTLVQLKSMPIANYSSMTLDILRGREGELMLYHRQILDNDIYLPAFDQTYAKLTRKLQFKVACETG